MNKIVSWIKMSKLFTPHNTFGCLLNFFRVLKAFSTLWDLTGPRKLRKIYKIFQYYLKIEHVWRHLAFTGHVNYRLL